MEDVFRPINEENTRRNIEEKIRLKKEQFLHLLTKCLVGSILITKLAAAANRRAAAFIKNTS